MTEKTIRIGGASGAWGDSPGALAQLLGAGVDYLMMDYLAEVSMSLLARARLKDPDGGFPPDAIQYLAAVLPEITAKGVKIASNAGGVNPAGAKRALEAIIKAQGLSLKVAIVEGDDVLPMLPALREQNIREAVSGEPIPARLLTANAYLGALPIKAAFDAGADIVLTGRCADSALALGILMHEFAWSATDYDHLAAGSLVGHILECGPQATGGNFTDWQTVPDWHNIGYPIATCRADGTFGLTKPPHTGGLITPPTVAEQTLYEIADPAAYFLPDVVADFSHVTITQAGDNAVEVSGAKGRPPTTQYKVSATYQAGYRSVATVSIVGPDAAAKAERTGRTLIDRAEMIFARENIPPFDSTHIEALGAEASYGPKSQARASREVLLRLVVVHQRRDALEIFGRELGSIGLSCAPGTTGIYSGRPKPTPVVRLFTMFLDKSAFPAPRLTLGDAAPVEIPVPLNGGYEAPHPSGEHHASLPAFAPGETEERPLITLAYGRSGDKGNSSNIAIFARKPEYLPYLREILTPEKILAQLDQLVTGPAERFDTPGLHALNFLIQNALGGGGMASLRIDPQGKAYAQMVLEMPIPIPKAWL
jgi:hypothetical protein